MRVIHKFPLRMLNCQTVRPMAGEIIKPLSIQIQHGDYMMWAVVDTALPTKSRMVHMLGTGHGLPDHVSVFEHVSTVQDGTFVWHFFIET